MSNLYRKGSAALIVNKKNQFLLINLISYQEIFFTIPSGGREKGETFLETIYRELNEELNIDKKDLELVGESIVPLMVDFRTPQIKEGIEYKGSEKYYFGFKYIGDENIKVNQEEVRSCKWVDIKDFKDYLLFDDQLEDTMEKINEIFVDI